MKTGNKKLVLKKNTIVELNDNALNSIKGGSLDGHEAIFISISGISIEVFSQTTASSAICTNATG